MNCPKCGKQMFSKYRDGGSVLICRACESNFGQDFEMPNPDWIGNKIKDKVMREKATLSINPKRVEEIIREHYKAKDIDVSGVSFEIGDVYDDRPGSRPIKGFKSATVTVDL
jgi:hypothetical protein